MKKTFRMKIVILVFIASILFFIQGCRKTTQVNKDNNEINALLYFFKVTNYGGDTQIKEFRKFNYDKDTIYYYLKWKYISGENTDEREHLIVFEIPTLESVLYPLNYINDYPSIKEGWDEVIEKNKFTVFSKDEVDKFIEIVDKLRER